MRFSTLVAGAALAAAGANAAPAIEPKNLTAIREKVQLVPRLHNFARSNSTVVNATQIARPIAGGNSADTEPSEIFPFRIDCRDYGVPLHRRYVVRAVDNLCEAEVGRHMDDRSDLVYRHEDLNSNYGTGPWTTELTISMASNWIWEVDEAVCKQYFRHIIDKCDTESTKFKQGGTLEFGGLHFKMNNTLGYRMPEAPWCWHWTDPGCPGEGFPEHLPNIAAHPENSGGPRKPWEEPNGSGFHEMTPWDMQEEVIHSREGVTSLEMGTPDGIIHHAELRDR
ncbi:hypothetical protein K490DRAFT_68468 [Saccharata proteae CBS 121410]|uniref:Uncharacterized protein n=1 Tax=Saccharata proteae CBS 121410 TaxID=1314787 RepID=A0A9P4HS94_9PEZI|nr:hypothetical protein K490DRAFT_68468 [Saccharata proteae CBS 121410]